MRVAWEGGFVPVDWTYTNLPIYSLYGDGRIVVPGAQIEIYPAPALPAISSRSVGEEGIQAILREVLDATEDLPDDLDDMGSVMIADAPTTVISISVDEVDRTVRVYALGEQTERPEGMPEDVFRARQELQALVTKLTGPGNWLPEGSLGPEADYEASGSRLILTDVRRDEGLPQSEVAWPLEGAARGLRRARRRRRVPMRRRGGRGLVHGPRGGDGGEPAHPVGRRGGRVLDPVPTAPAGRSAAADRVRCGAS